MNWDAIIVGSGPAGATAAMYLGKAGKKVLLCDLAPFPRDKICGDAQGRKAAAILKELGIYEEYLKLPGQPIYGLTLSSPNGTQMEFDVTTRDQPAPGFVHRRIVLDNYLHHSAKRWATFKVLEVTDLIIHDGHQVVGIRGKNESGQAEEHHAPIVLGADGANSVIVKKMGLPPNPMEHFIVALRAYYTGVTGMTDRIEIHMIKSLIPGYFWIFPLPNGEANVGLGMITEDMQKKKVNLQKAMLEEIEKNPLFKERFKNAKLMQPIRAYNLPVASWHRKCYGDGWLLLGDAASLIDPLSGEGVGNAMISGRVAAHVALEALQKQDFSEKFFQRYDKQLWDTIGDEIKTSYKIQKLGKRFPHLIDELMVRCKKSEEFRNKVEKLLPYTSGREQLGSPDFIFDFLMPKGGAEERAVQEEIDRAKIAS